MSNLFIEQYPPTYIGPTWLKGEDGRFCLPERTLGWDIAGWASAYCLDPNSTEDDPQPWRFTNEQLRFVLWWYAIDEDGRFIYRSGLLQRLKGWGKDPLLAIIALVEFVGPSRFGGWDKNGDPIAVICDAAWVQVVAVSKEQSETTFELFPRLISAHMKAEYRIKDGAELIRGRGGRCRIQAVTRSYRSLEGKRATFVLLNEIQHWVAGNLGKKMFDTIRSNASKLGNRYISITNAYLPGEDSVGESERTSYNEIAEGRAVDVGFLYDSIEAHPKTPLTREVLPHIIPAIRGDSWWVTSDNISGEILRTNASPARSRRMWYNQIVADEDALYEEDDWDVLSRNVPALNKGDKIVMGFDGGQSDDSTALVAIRVSDGYVEPLHFQERPYGEEDWEVNRPLVDSKVHEAFATYNVVAFYCDRAQWDSEIASWGAIYGHQMIVAGSDPKNKIVWDMRGAVKRVTDANMLLMGAIKGKTLCHRGKELPANPLIATLRRHLLNTRRRENIHGLSFGKESADSPLKVDGYAALLMAHEALNNYRQKTSGEKPASGGKTWFF